MIEAKKRRPPNLDEKKKEKTQKAQKYKKIKKGLKEEKKRQKGCENASKTVGKAVGWVTPTRVQRTG